MRNKLNNLEKGQSVVLLALAFVVLLGFTALAIDGGMVYADRRFAQNAADTASLAGGGAAALKLENEYVKEYSFDCGSAKVYKAATAAVTDAIYRAGDNGFLIDPEISDDHGVTVTCGVDNTGPFSKHYLDVLVKIRMETRTAFAHFVYPGKLENKVEAVTRVYPRQPLAYGNAIVSLNPALCDGQEYGAVFHGSAVVDITGGGVFSNGCLNGSGQPDVLVVDGHIEYGEEFIPGNTNWDPGPQYSDKKIPEEDYLVEVPDCSLAGAHNVTGAQLAGMSPLSPGLYCVTGDLFLNGGEFIGDQVTIVMLDGELRINGNVLVQLTAPAIEPRPAPAIPGLLFYAPATNSNPITLNGTSESFFTGTVFAPASNISLLGTGYQDAYKTQVIGWNVEAGGTADTYVTYNDNLNYTMPASLRLEQ
jgi:hypothetical protein